MLLFAADIVAIALDDYYQYYHLLLVVASGGVGVDPAPENASGRSGAGCTMRRTHRAAPCTRLRLRCRSAKELHGSE